MKIHHTHIKRIKKLFQERFTLTELYIMYKEKIPYNRLREITKDVKRHERI